MDGDVGTYLRHSIAYFRDSFVPFNKANLSIASSSVLYGLSIYTVFSVNWNIQDNEYYIFRLKDHFERLINSARIMDFQRFIDDWNYARFKKTMLELLSKNELKGNLLVRVTVFIDEQSSGTRIHGLKNGVSAYVYSASELLSPDGVNLGVSSWVRNMDNSIPAKAKINGSYVNAALMKNEAILNGYDDAIALDHNGHVAESTVANLFIAKNGELITPDKSTDILEGITRDSILEISKVKAIKCIERSIDRTELYKADEAFLCGSSVRITPILSIDRRKIGDGRVGKLTSRLMQEFADIQLGKKSYFKNWLIKL